MSLGVRSLGKSTANIAMITKTLAESRTSNPHLIIILIPTVQTKDKLILDKTLIICFIITSGQFGFTIPS
jgi:hypothetical protein